MISKIYFAIVTLFIFISGLLLVVFIMLQNGIFIEKLSISNIQIKELYIKWNEKIDVSLKEIQVISKKSTIESTTTFNYKKINRYLLSLSQTKNWFNSITIEHILYNDFKGSFTYKDNKNGFLLVKSKNFNLDVSIAINQEILLAKIQNLYDKKKDIRATGTLLFDTANINLYTDINFLISDEINATLYSKATTKDIYYKIVSNKEILDYRHTLSLAHLPKEARYWAYDAIKMSSLNINSAYGYLQYIKLNEALLNIHVLATAKKLDYSYNKKLDAIHTQSTNLEFIKGMLYIRPQNAHTYRKDLGSSWLKIDFTRKEELLTLYLLFKDALDENMLSILDAYKIKLPFLQKRGRVKTDLQIVVGLRNIHVNAKGHFYIKKANFDYLGLNIDIVDTDVVLNNYDVSIKNMSASYLNVAKAKVNLTYNAAKEKGKIDFSFSDISLNGVRLKKGTPPLKASYIIEKNNDRINVAHSSWSFNNQTITIQPLIMPFNLNKLTLTIPTTFVELQNIGTSFIEGSICLADMSAKLNADILKFQYEGIHLNQSNAPLEIVYNKELSISSKNTLFLDIVGTLYKINNVQLVANKEMIKLKHTEVEIGKYIKTKVYANFNTKTKKSHISLSNFTLTNPKTKHQLYKNKKILLSVVNKHNILQITSKEIDGDFTLQDSGWKLKLHSLGRITKNSPLLKKFFVQSGDFTLYKNKNDHYTRFTSHIKYPYKIMLKNGIPTDKYKIKGKIYNDIISINLNKKINIKIVDDVTISLENTPININEIIRAISDISSDSNTSKALNININAKKSYLYASKARKVMYENLDIQYYNKILTAQLKHQNGKAGFKLQNKSFHLYGKDFNDNFMNEVFSLSKFHGGSLDFSMSGILNDYIGVVYVHKTTIKDYKTLNNILAFINTIPSLVTFGVPGYNKNGLFVKKSYVRFTSKNSAFHLNDIYLDSKELDILGKGDIDLKSDDLNITLNLKTDLGSDLSKVPLVGYILLDGDTVSTTLSLKGKASDPQVQSLIAKEIIVAPFNIIKRTLSLPYKLIKDAIDPDVATSR